MTDRRSVLRAAGAAAALAGFPHLRAATPFTWPRADPESLDIAGDLSARLEQGVKSGEFFNLHAVFIARRGKLAVESYFEGTDERWGTPLGKVSFNAGTLHDVRSVSKSVVGLLYGIALAEGKVPALDTPVVDAFPAYPDLARDERRRAILMSHVMTMTMGLEWNEDLPYTDSRNSEIAMERSRDRYRYILERPIVQAPGEKWRYGGGATAILGHLVSRGAGMPLLDYARAKLFAPLGIDTVEWTLGMNGEAAAASGLRLRAGDLARIGQLMLQHGTWEGRTIVPRDWIAASVTPRFDAWEGTRYGQHWYVAQRRDGSPAYIGIGLGGQRLIAIPSLDLVLVMYFGNYYRHDQIKPVLAVQGTVISSLKP